MTQYWYRTTVDYGQGTIKEYLTDDFPDRNDYSTGNIIKTTYCGRYDNKSHNAKNL